MEVAPVRGSVAAWLGLRLACTAGHGGRSRAEGGGGSRWRGPRATGRGCRGVAGRRPLRGGTGALLLGGPESLHEGGHPHRFLSGTQTMEEGRLVRSVVLKLFHVEDPQIVTNHPADPHLKDPQFDMHYRLRNPI